MFKPVKWFNTKPNNQAIRIAEKKDGTDIPKTPKNRANLSIQLSLKIAANMPIKTPSRTAKNIEESASTNVLGNVSEII